MKKLVVKWVKDDTYQVYEVEDSVCGMFFGDSVFQGTIAECEAYIRLTKRGLLI